MSTATATGGIVGTQKARVTAATTSRTALTGRVWKYWKWIVGGLVVLGLLFGWRSWEPSPTTPNNPSSTPAAPEATATKVVPTSFVQPLSKTEWFEVAVLKGRCIFFWPLSPSDQLEIQAHRPSGGDWMPWAEWKKLRRSGEIKTGLGWVRFRGDRVAYEFRRPGQCSS